MKIILSLIAISCIIGCATVPPQDPSSNVPAKAEKYWAACQDPGSCYQDALSRCVKTGGFVIIDEGWFKDNYRVNYSCWGGI